MASGDLSWVRSFSFSTVDGGGWTATAKTEVGSFTAVGPTFEEAMEELRRVTPTPQNGRLTASTADLTGGTPSREKERRREQRSKSAGMLATVG